MRIPFTTIEIRSAAALADEIAAAVRAEADLRAIQTLQRYARNPNCLRAAVAAHCGLSSDRFIAPDSSLLPAMQRAIDSFADRALQERRGVTVLDAAVRPYRRREQLLEAREGFARAMLT